MIEDFQKELTGKGLRVTPQRLAVMDALTNLSNHPQAERIIEYIHANYPNIATGTIYKTLETFVEKGLVKMVKTEKDAMRYDALIIPHHHLYCSESDRIEDYSDDNLNNLLGEYFNKREIPGFTIDDIKLQIIGRFN
jgi:Fur family peroxide stress response transcriptional regulator